MTFALQRAKMFG